MTSDEAEHQTRGGMRDGIEGLGRAGRGGGFIWPRRGGQGHVSRATAAAAPATLVVDNDKQQCPSAKYTRIRDAIQNAHAGDTVFVCAGTYSEGPGHPGTNAVEIHKNLTLKGAGADA